MTRKSRASLARTLRWSYQGKPYRSDVLTSPCHYGPCGMAKGWKNEDDTPSAEALAAFPHVSQRMSDAHDRIVRVLGLLRRRVQS